MNHPIAASPGGDRRWQAIGLQGLLFVALACLLVAANHPVIGYAHTELGDYAANSVLVQDAMHLRLLVGNYSRIGFNHPGPVILYVLAFGELVFYDALSLVPSPFSGQLVGVAIYSAFWLVALFRLALRMTRSTAASVFAVAVFLGSTALLNSAFLIDPWFPHLYYLPFAVTVVAAARLAAGYADSLPILAIGSGFVINGHVSFVSTVAVLYVAILIYNFLAFRSTEGERFILSRRFLATNYKQLAIAIGLLVLFFVPLGIETIVHYPGPLYGYATFGGAHEPNTVPQAITFVAVYWGGLNLLVLPIAAAGLVVCLPFAGKAPRRTVRGLIGMLVGATVALFVYARYGVDLLDQVYIGFFYYAVPLLLATIVALCAFALVSDRTRRWLATLVVLASVVVTFSTIHGSPMAEQQYDGPGVRSLFDALRAHASRGRVVLDLDDTVEWGRIWTELVGVEAYAKRRHVDLFCVNKRWHVLFSRQARCEPDEVDHNAHYVVYATVPHIRHEGVAEFESYGLSFFKFVVPDVVDHGVITVGAKPDWFNDALLGTGWSRAESDFVWSDGEQAILNIPVHPDTPEVVTLDLGAFLPLQTSQQTITIEVAGQTVATATFTSRNNRQLVSFKAQADSDRLVVNVQVKAPIMPKSVSNSADSRLLGVSLYSLRVDHQ